MKTFLTSVLFIAFSVISIFSQSNRNLKANKINNNTFSFSVDPTLHSDFGLAYPVTYEFSILNNNNNLSVYKKYSASENWNEITEKTSNDFFNGIEVFRYDETNNLIFVSAAFGDNSDSLFIKIEGGQNLSINFLGLTKYYDNREAVVTCSIDDWQDFINDEFVKSVHHLRENNLFVTAGIITDPEFCSPETWQTIQNELDSGYVEAASHSRTHPHVPYENPVYEVTDSKEDIITHLNLPQQYKKGNKEYVYVWIAPYGEYDEVIDSLVSVNKYIVSRLVNDNDDSLSAWQPDKNKFAPTGFTFEMGEAPWGGLHNIDTMNSIFDNVIDKGEVYHLMFHPQVLRDSNSWAKGYPDEHFKYIANRKNIWYTTLGHLYVYHLLEYNNATAIVSDENKKNKKLDFILYQNYPNPFNPVTTIKYSITKTSFVTIKIYNSLGEEIKTLIKQEENPGAHSVRFDATGIASGVYFYKMEANSFTDIKKLIVVK